MSFTPALHNKSRRTNSVRKYATSIRRSPIWNILVQSALSITLRYDGLLRIVQKDVTNWRLASADCVPGRTGIEGYIPPSDPGLAHEAVMKESERRIMNTMWRLILWTVAIVASPILMLSETHRFIPTVFYSTYSYAHPPALRIKPGDRVITKTLDAGGSDETGKQVASNGANP